MIALLLVALQDPLQEIDELRREVETLRSIHQLELSKEQLGKLAGVCRKARKSIDDAVAERKQELEALRTALREYREALEKGETDLADRERRLGEHQRTVGELMRRQQEAVERLSAELKEALDERQWKRISEMHRPDPTRPMREQVGRFIDRLREDPELQLNDDVLNRWREGVTRTAKQLGLPEKDAEAEWDRIRKILVEMFDASGEDLAKKRDEYVRRMFDEGRIAEAVRRTGPPADEVRRRVALMLVQPKVVAFLEKRAQK